MVLSYCDHGWLISESPARLPLTRSSKWPSPTIRTTALAGAAGDRELLAHQRASRPQTVIQAGSAANKGTLNIRHATEDNSTQERRLSPLVWPSFPFLLDTLTQIACDMVILSFLFVSLITKI